MHILLYLAIAAATIAGSLGILTLAGAAQLDHLLPVPHSDPADLPSPPTARWGVEFGGSPSPDHVTVCADEAGARRFCRGLEFCGNADACLVVDDGHGWHPADTTGGAA